MKQLTFASSSLQAVNRPNLQSLSLDPWYTTSRADLAREFYIPCLERATQYDRAVGYFSSSLYSVVSAALAQFIDYGGKIRLVCSPHFSEADIQAIRDGLDLRQRLQDNLVADIRAITRNPANVPAIELLATLVGAGILDIKVAYRSGKAGIFHSKIGIFSTESASVGFEGSANETQAAFVDEGNHESFAVFASWTNDVDRERVIGLQEYFDSLWEGGERRLTVVDLPEVPREELRLYANSRGVDAALEKVRSNRAEPRSPGPRSRSIDLMKHQTEAIASWEDSEYRGIVQHATGAGKTVTALEAISRWIRCDRPALILVPSDLLVSQWTCEIESYFSGLDWQMLIIGGSHGARGWEDDLPDFTRDAKYLGPRIVLATMQSAATPRFLNGVVQGKHILVVADEVHRIGSPRHRRVMAISSGGRLGLSATPKRYGDPEGTDAILGYFGKVLKPKFGIPEAIRAGRLVPYSYHVVEVALNQYEQERWDTFTERIRKAYARLPEADGIKITSPAFQTLLIQRARILKQARSKVEAAHQTVTHNYRDGDRWLVYCDDSNQLNEVLVTFHAAGLPVSEYWSGSDSALPETLEFFARNGGILVAIRCLDEGVDLPALDHALILASSANPREFIQRRGRVLRRAPGKFRSVIYDTLVVPDTTEEAAADRLPILKTELRRASEFSLHAQNRATHYRLQRIAAAVGLADLNRFSTDFEEHENGE